MTWLMLASLAHGWPADDAWVPLTQGGAPMTDPSGDHGGLDESGDLSSAAEPVLSWFVDADDVYLRMQVRRSPENGSSWFAPQDWAWLLDTDGDDATVETALMVHADLVATDVRVFEGNGDPGVSPALTFQGVLGTLDEVDPPVRTEGVGSEHFIDVRLTRTEAEVELGWSTVGVVRVAGANATAFALGWDDIATCDDSTTVCSTLAPVLSDPIAIDQDEDTVVDHDEALWGTDPLDEDTDDDGLIDPLDYDLDPLFDSDGDGLTDPLDPDSDDDGLLDGLEAGVSVLPDGTDPGAHGAAVDADPSTTTSPWAADTDAGGLPDGAEDWNGDGEQGFWETDPNDGADDADTDGDGIPDVFDGQDPAGDIDDEDSDGDGILDVDEFLFDTDGDNVPDFLDDDSDDDGILDLDEGGGDTDGDGVPDFRDLDSDGDTVPDDIEGTDDLDGDGLGNWIDEDADGDGIDDIDEADVDGDGVLDDTDGDGTPDVFDNDLDSDGDGIPDNVEGYDDADGDGIPNHLDEDSDGDGFLDEDEADRDEDGVLDDTDEDGIPDFLDEDSDGDGIPDSQELGDEDCDGVPDVIDAVVDEDLCDTPTTTPYTYPGTTDPFTDGDDPNPLAQQGQFTGGSCSTSGSSGAAGLGLALLGLAFRRRRRTAAVATAAAVGIGGMSPAQAQDINVQRFRPSVDGGPMLKVEDLRLADRGGLGVVAHYADDPFVFRPEDGSDPTDILGSVGTTSLLGHATLGAVRIGAELPLHLYAQGFQVEGPVHLGDARLSSKLRAVDTDAFDLGAALDVMLPTGDADAYLGAGNVVVDGRLLAQLDAGQATVAANLGGRNGTGETFQALTVTPAIVWGLGASYALSEPTSVALELDGEGWVGNGGQSGAAPVEWLASVHQGLGNATLRLGGGSGLTRGVGAPDLRVVAGLSWRFLAEPEEPEAVVLAPAPPAPGRLVVRITDPKGAAIPTASVRVLGAEEPVSSVGPDGIVERSLPAKSYEIAVSAEGYEATNRMIDLAPDGTADLVLQLRPVVAEAPDDVVVDEESQRIYLNRKIFFELDKAELKVESLGVLDRLVEVLVENPDIGRVRIEGHTDSQGKEQHNLELSDARAQSVKAYLVQEGVAAERLEARGYGESRLLQQGDSDEVHATNRRVEFHLLPTE